MSVLCLVVALALSTAAPEKTVTYLYKSIDESTGEVVGESSRTVRRLSATAHEVSITWSSFTDSTSGSQHYIVDNDYSTLEWTVQHPDEKTEYRAVRDGEFLTISGTHEGEPIEKRLEIDDKHFYNNPSFNLQGFVRSGDEKTEFRTLRPSKMSQYKMKAKVEEHTVITIQGKEVAAVRVKWGLTGLKSKFFKQNLWFRESDGVFLRAQPREGVFSEFAGERSEPVRSSH